MIIVLLAIIVLILLCGSEAVRSVLMAGIGIITILIILSGVILALASGH